jgi:hypothetical protein
MEVRICSEKAENVTTPTVRTNTEQRTVNSVPGIFSCVSKPTIKHKEF